jgi:hypothetical protein
MPRFNAIIVPDISPPVSHYCHATRAAGVVGQAHGGSIRADIIAQFDIAITAMDRWLKAAVPAPSTSPRCRCSEPWVAMFVTLRSAAEP